MRHESVLEDGRAVTTELVREEIRRTVEKLRGQVPEAQLTAAAKLYEEMLTDREFPEFLTLRAYEELK